MCGPRPCRRCAFAGRLRAGHTRPLWCLLQGAMPGIALRAASLQGGGVPGTHPAFTFKRKRFSLMRASGILMPISSLPSAHGIGAMGAEARRFVEFLSKAGQAYWQILPICPTSYGDSP